MLKKFVMFARGFLTVHYGSCAGDPIAWEQDLLRRRAEKAQREAVHDDRLIEEEETLEAGALVTLRRPTQTDDAS